MFTSLHALAQAATLLVVVKAEGADLLRINVTPTRTDDKTKPHTLRPLSLVGTPAELDEGFADALAEWQAPRRSLIEQARDTGDDDVKAAASSKAAKPSLPAPDKKAEAAPAAGRKKPGPKPKASSADAAPAGAAVGDAAAGADAALADDSATTASSAVADDSAGAEPASDAGAAAPAEATAGGVAEPAADEFTLDLF